MDNNAAAGVVVLITMIAAMLFGYWVAIDD